MSIERELNSAVRVMFSHAKSIVSRNITNAIRTGKISIDESKIPGLDLLVQQSLDDALKQSAKELTSVVQANIKKGLIKE